jgi:hypothetical protein
MVEGSSVKWAQAAAGLHDTKASHEPSWKGEMAEWQRLHDALRQYDKLPAVMRQLKTCLTSRQAEVCDAMASAGHLPEVLTMLTQALQLNLDSAAAPKMREHAAVVLATLLSRIAGAESEPCSPCNSPCNSAVHTLVLSACTRACSCQCLETSQHARTPTRVHTPSQAPAVCTRRSRSIWRSCWVPAPACRQRSQRAWETRPRRPTLPSDARGACTSSWGRCRAALPRGRVLGLVLRADCSGRGDRRGLSVHIICTHTGGMRHCSPSWRLP